MNCLKPDKFTNNFLHDHEFLFNKNMIMRQIWYSSRHLRRPVSSVLSWTPVFTCSFLFLTSCFSLFQAVLLSAPMCILPAYVWCSGSSAPSPSGAPPLFCDMNKLLSMAFKKVHDVDPPCFSSLISLVYCGHPCLCPCVSCFIMSFPTDPFARNSLFFPLNQEHSPWILSLRHISNVTLSHQRMSTFILESL